MHIHKFPRNDKVIWALVPVKELERSKQRLEPCLGDSRQEFTLAMLKDVLNALQNCKTIAHIAIVTSDSRVKAIATNYGALVVNESGSGGMNPAITQGLKAIDEAGGTHVTVVPVDIPLVTGQEIDRLVQIMLTGVRDQAEPAIGICPSTDHGGTNFLYLEVDCGFDFAYGPDSFHAHIKAASEVSGLVVTLSSPTISLDLDRQSDLEQYVDYCQLNSACRATETWRFLCAGGYINNLENEQRMQR